MRRHIRSTMLCAAAVALLPITACNEDPSAPGADHGDFDVTISSGVNPQYSWDGGSAFSVSVMRTSAPSRIVWTVADPDGEIPSPVTHGTVPAGAVAANTVETTLMAGASYRVSVTLPDGRTGWDEFRP